MERSSKDQIYVRKRDSAGDFIFDEKVASVFSDLIQRSVPGYIAMNQLLPIVAKQFVHQGSNVYDLGCSLGEASISLAKSIEAGGVKIYAIDNSKAMIHWLDERLTQLNIENQANTICKDITKVEIVNASFAVLNYTLQFIERTKRDAFINRVFAGIKTGGALLLSEKVTFESAEEDQLMQQLYEDYKRQNDYSDLEISQKREALENILICDKHEEHVRRLKTAEFEKISVLSKHLNFVSYLAIKK